MRPFKDGKKCTVWRTLCALVALQEGSIALDVRCLDPGSLLGFQLKSHFGRISHTECYGHASWVALATLS
jgi:hypothetical protein